MRPSLSLVATLASVLNLSALQQNGRSGCAQYFLPVQVVLQYLLAGIPANVLNPNLQQKCVAIIQETHA